MAPSDDRVQDSRPEDDNRHDTTEADENTPLLPTTSPSAPDRSQPHHEQSATSLLNTLNNDNGSSKSGSVLKRRWPSLLALLLLCITAALIIIFAFIAPSLVAEYASEAAVFEPTSLSIAGFTSAGVQARVQGEFRMDARKVKKQSARNFGRFGTWIAREVESGNSEVEVSLPEYGNVVLGTAMVPPVKVSVRNGHTTEVDFLSEVRPGPKEGLRRLADDWIAGRLGRLRVLGKAEVPVKSGIFSFGEQLVRQEMVFEHGDMPAIPAYDILKLNVHDREGEGMAADVELQVENKFPVDLEVPPLAFQVLVDGCKKNDPYILVGDAVTEKIHVQPKKDVLVDATGAVRGMPPPLTQDCPHSDQSPLDIIVGNFMRGKENTIYVRGSKVPDSDTPDWMTDLMKGIVVPVPLPGKTMGHLIRNFSLEHTHFSLPDPFADTDSPESNPRISAQVQALVALPEEMNFNISATQVRADATVLYKKKKLGDLDLSKWQPANSTRVANIEGGGDGLLVQSSVDQAPLVITDDDVFTDVIQDMMFGGKGVTLHIKADVDVQVATALGEFKIRGIPAEGEVPIQPIISPNPPGGGDGSNITDSLHPRVVDLRILETSSTGLTITALINITNPTVYSASVPYADILILCNDTLLGHATARDLSITTGDNHNLLVSAVYDPFTFGGPDAKANGRELLSQYISGYNTTLTLRTHNGTFPSQPLLGQALSRFNLTFPTPRLPPPPRKPDDDDDDDGGDPAPPGPHFLADATMHLLTSTATLTLLSPLRHSTLALTSINATAYYHASPVGHIDYDLPFDVPPVTADGHGSVTPRLPVDWWVGSAGFEALKGALGGRLKLEAKAEVGVRIGKWEELVWFVGKGLGAKVRL